MSAVFCLGLSLSCLFSLFGAAPDGAMRSLAHHLHVFLYSLFCFLFFLVTLMNDNFGRTESFNRRQNIGSPSRAPLSPSSPILQVCFCAWPDKSSVVWQVDNKVFPPIIRIMQAGHSVTDASWIAASSRLLLVTVRQQVFTKTEEALY